MSNELYVYYSSKKNLENVDYRLLECEYTIFSGIDIDDGVYSYEDLKYYLISYLEDNENPDARTIIAIGTIMKNIETDMYVYIHS